MDNIFKALPETLEEELIETLLHHANVRIERIVSKGHTSPETGWYDQEEHEWVVVLQGAATILFRDGRKVALERGDFIDIAPHAQHKVLWTDPTDLTIWLAVFCSPR